MQINNHAKKKVAVAHKGKKQTLLQWSRITTSNSMEQLILLRVGNYPNTEHPKSNQ